MTRINKICVGVLLTKYKYSDIAKIELSAFMFYLSLMCTLILISCGYFKYDSVHVNLVQPTCIMISGLGQPYKK